MKTTIFAAALAALFSNGVSAVPSPIAGGSVPPPGAPQGYTKTDTPLQLQKGTLKAGIQAAAASRLQDFQRGYNIPSGVDQHRAIIDFQSAASGNAQFDPWCCQVYGDGYGFCPDEYDYPFAVPTWSTCYTPTNQPYWCLFYYPSNYSPSNYNPNGGWSQYVKPVQPSDFGYLGAQGKVATPLGDVNVYGAGPQCETKEDGTTQCVN